MISLAFADGEIVGKYPWRYGNVGCAFDRTGNIFYVYHEAEHTVYALDGTDFTPLDTVAVPFSISHADYAWSMAFDGTNLWLLCPWNGDNPGLYGMDPVSGDSVGYIDVGLGGIIRGVDWDGSNFWIGTNDGGTGMIYKISPSGNQLKSFTLDEVAWLNQICLAEEQIWINDDRLNFTSYDTSGTFLQKVPTQIPGAWGQLSHDLSFDGNDVITICWDQNFIYKMYIGKGLGEYLVAPTNFMAESSPSTPTSITLSWTNPTEYLNGNAATASSTNIYNADTDGLIANTGSEEYIVDGLTNAEFYNFYLKSVSGTGTEGVVSGILGYRAGGPLAGDVINQVSLGKTGWVSVVWDGSYAWIANEQEVTWSKINITTGETLKSFDIPEGAAANGQGAAWSPLGTIFVNEYAAGSGEVWEIDTTGVVVNFWPTDILGASGATNRQRGLTIYDDMVWVGLGNIDNVPNHEIFRFDFDGVPLASAFVDTPIVYSGGYEFVNGQLWVNDRGAGVLRIYDYNGTDSLFQEREVGRPSDFIWGLAFTGNEVLTAAWSTTENLFYLKPGTSAASIEDDPGYLIHSFKLVQNYPNPFNPSTTIDYSIPKAEDVTLEIYNLLGQRVVTLVDENQTAGEHTVQWNGFSQDGQPVSSGVYFYKLISGEYSSIKKMMLLR
jgi:hypothetical protein